MAICTFRSLGFRVDLVVHRYSEHPERPAAGLLLVADGAYGTVTALEQFRRVPGGFLLSLTTCSYFQRLSSGTNMPIRMVIPCPAGGFFIVEGLVAEAARNMPSCLQQWSVW